MRIEHFVHKGLKELYLEDSAKGVPADAMDKLRKMLAFLQEMDNENELGHPYLEGASPDRRPKGRLES